MGVEQDDRTKILEAMAAELSERTTGAGTVTPMEVQLRAGVSPAVFHSLFVDLEACLLATFDLGVQRASASVIPAFKAEASWLDAIKAALASLLCFLEEEPTLGRLLVFHSLGAGADVQRRRREVSSALATVVDGGASRSQRGRHRPPPVIAEGVVGAVAAILQNHMLAERPEPLLLRFGELISVIVLPYLGSSVARRELSRPVPPPRAQGYSAIAANGRVAASAPVRITYRTARVLHAIADYPGASNREVAERAGIVDQGQISKLLGRLEARALIANKGGSKARGAPNAWQLSEYGAQLLNEASVSRSGM